MSWCRIAIHSVKIYIIYLFINHRKGIAGDRGGVKGVDGTQIGVCWPDDSGVVLWLLVRLLDRMDSITPLSTDSIQVGQ